jgi:hypothetical protein
MKKTLFLILTCMVSVALVLSCATTGGGGGVTGGFAGAFGWGAFNDAASGGSSTITLIEDIEQIGGEAYMTYNISGAITNQYEYGYAGWYCRPDDATLEKLLTAKSFTFQVLGDGQAYDFMVCTSDIEDSAFYRQTFNTKKDQVITVTVRTSSLAQPEYWGAKKRFNQNLVEQIQFQTTLNGTPGTFKLKIWDIRIHE